MRLGLFVTLINFAFLGSNFIFAASETKFYYAEGMDLSGRLGLYSPYWVCGDTRQSKLKLKCDDLGTNEDEGPKAEFQIFFNTDHSHHEYGLRHGIEAKECFHMMRIIRRLLKKETKFCVGGDLADIDKSKSEIGWVFDEFRVGKTSVCTYDECY